MFNEITPSMSDNRLKLSIKRISMYWLFFFSYKPVNNGYIHKPNCTLNEKFLKIEQLHAVLIVVKHFVSKFDRILKKLKYHCSVQTMSDYKTSHTPTHTPHTYIYTPSLVSSVFGRAC